MTTQEEENMAYNLHRLSKRKVVYIASPYTLGDVAMNVKLQIDTANELMNYGFVPFAPLYSHFQHMVHPRRYRDWIDVDLAWVQKCDILLRIGGESKGADGEVLAADMLNIPIVSSVEELVDKYYLKS